MIRPNLQLIPYLLTFLAMVAFAGNSLLCRAALTDARIDAASFTSIRLISGAGVLWVIVRMRHVLPVGKGNWRSAWALFIYAAAFSFAYVSLPAATGALLLFGAVQATMISYGLYMGERLDPRQLLGILIAFAGIVGLLLPGLSTPPLIGSLLMLASGIAWGIYSLRGKSIGNPTRITAGNFLRAVPITIVLSLAFIDRTSLEGTGVLLAIMSGGLASGIGYVLWYTALPHLKATPAATVQLSVPVLAALGGVLFLGEPLTLRFSLAALAILGGIALSMRKPDAIDLTKT